MEALEKVRTESDLHEQAVTAERTRKDSLHAAIVAALRAGAGPAAIERVAHYDRQHIDRIRRAAGIPPRRAATVQKIQKDGAAPSP